MCVVEVKTGSAALEKGQVEAYLDLVKQEGFDCVLTISNEIEKIPGEHPVAVDKRKLRSIGLYHLSWSRILTEAIMQGSYRGVSDPDQAWILAELVRYLEHPKAGSGDFSSMGEHWVPVRDSVKNGTVRTTDRNVTEVAGKWEELVTFAALRLRRELGADVREVLAPKERSNISVRISNIVDSMVKTGRMPGAIQIPDTVDDIKFHADLRTQQIVASVNLSAPRDKRSLTRVKWLLRQLEGAPDDIRIESWGLRSRSSLSELLSKARQKPELLVPDDGHEIGTFTVSLIRQMGLKRGTGPKTFIDSVLGALQEFYGSVVQHLREWQPPAPKMRTDQSRAEPTVSDAQDAGKLSPSTSTEIPSDSMSGTI